MLIIESKLFFFCFQFSSGNLFRVTLSMIFWAPVIDFVYLLLYLDYLSLLSVIGNLCHNFFANFLPRILEFIFRSITEVLSINLYAIIFISWSLDLFRCWSLIPFINLSWFPFLRSFWDLFQYLFLVLFTNYPLFIFLSRL